MKGIKPLNKLKFNAVEHFYLTDFNLLATALKCGMTTNAYRVWAHLEAYERHRLSFQPKESAQQLGLTLDEFIQACDELTTITVLASSGGMDRG